jgi:NAD(P)-dependent dehydrogenase (short-subunit alcohol dehydrogenase family)
MRSMPSLADVFGLEGRGAIVTGASSGLGVEFAEALAIAGANVAIVARRADRLEAVAERLATYGRKIAPVAADLEDLASIPDVVARCEKTIGPIDILVNNAGRQDPVRAEKTTPEQWTALLDLNLTAGFRLAQEVARRCFARSAAGRIVNVGSIFGVAASPMPGYAAYAASKGAITALTRQLAIEWGPRGITVNTLAPGFFPTELNARSFEKPGIRDRVEQSVPLGRLGRPGELTAALLFLVSPVASYVTGSTVLVDGGYTAW